MVEDNAADGGGSTRLADRPFTELERQRDLGGSNGSTRLADRPNSAFEARRLQRQRRQEAIAQRREQFGDALGLDSGLISPVQLDDRGEDIGFVPGERGRSILASRFAADRPFVNADQTLVDADPVEGVQTRTDPDAIPDIAAAARQSSAAEADFITAEDIRVDVGPGGVTEIETRPGRRDDIATRTRTGLAADDPFAEPGDFDVNVGPSGIEAAGLSDSGARRRAGRQFAAETPLTSVDPASDVRPTDGGFALTTSAQRRVAARQFERDLGVFGGGELDPRTDIRSTNGGFGLAEGPAREAAAADLDAQVSEFDIGPEDIRLEPTDSGGFEAIFEREVRR